MTIDRYMYIFFSISVPSVSGTLLPMLSDLPGPSSGPSIGGGGSSFLSPFFPTSPEDSDCDYEHIGYRKYHRDYKTKAANRESGVLEGEGNVRGRGGGGRSRGNLRGTKASEGE